MGKLVEEGKITPDELEIDSVGQKYSKKGKAVNGMRVFIGQY